MELGIDKLFQMLTSKEKKEKEKRRELMLNREGMSGRDGNGAGQGRRMGFSSSPCIVLSCLVLAPPRMTRKTFSPHPCPLGAHEAPPHPEKLYFLFIFPTTSTIFLMKPISLIKIYLKLQLNSFHQIKSNFRKKKN